MTHDAVPVAGFRHLLLLTALGAQTLVVELTIPRMIAPVFGNTLFSWTAIIAVVLAALTLGYRFGGRLAVRARGSRWIVVLSMLAAAWVIALSVVGDRVTGELAFLNLMAGPLAASLLLGAAPAFLDAAVVPLVIQQRPEESGEASGICFAWSTVGSIIGVLATGYLLLPQLGISGTLVSGALLVIASVAVLGRLLPAALGLALALAAVQIAGTRTGDLLVDMSNGYHRIRVLEPSANIRQLYLDSTLEGVIRVGTPWPVARYQQELQRIVSVLEPQSTMVIGGGAFTIPRFVAALFPKSVVEVVEIDPDVVRTGREHLELGDGIEVWIGDGRRVLWERDRRFDLIVNDAFQGLRRIPFHLTTTGFNADVADRLTPDGVYAINVRGHPASSLLAGSIVMTLSEHFRELRIVSAGSGNSWVLASQVPLPFGEPVDRSALQGEVLTDDRAPIEYLVIRDIVARRLSF